LRKRVHSSCGSRYQGQLTTAKTVAHVYNRKLFEKPLLTKQRKTM